ncbi:DUF2004 domain-containing protein [Rufibacter glacialis]|uniref:DUF2004 domain-containing protein n=1 Tax=Rufibacter glacialis TaxID=1259555 RepID=A0A5M8Q916_9BACT|nr:DUF2004 domain-containing protein [Rufibacter glacialis]KAA6431638.1 DUF2004 domain-containing protein [Rufibacter glacialis]GGK82769.1 hypothetical protein GCM10011405_33220 [Rufibacter glacialis]
MNNHQLPFFESIDISTLKEYYKVHTILDNSKISIDINFEKKFIDENTFQVLKNFLESIPKFDEQNKSLISNDFKEEGEAFDYINFYLDELGQEELSSIINIDNDNYPKEKQLLDKLRLIRVGLYPDGKYDADYFGVFDYSIEIDGEPCNQLLVVKTDVKDDLDHITWES